LRLLAYLQIEVVETDTLEDAALYLFAELEVTDQVVKQQ
jgi:hypothetical protein